MQQRSKEIGIRVALGAESKRIAGMVVFEGLRFAVVGVIVGLVGARALTRFISGFLFGVPADDPLVFVGIPAILTLVALIAVWTPARRASRIDPLVFLRTE